MSLGESQEFLTRYIRDQSFRERWRGGESEMLKAEIGLTNEDMALVDQIPLEDLDRTADGFRDDRLGKRRSEFSHFLDHIALYGPVDEFLGAYDRAYPEGMETQVLEMDQFLAFSMRFVQGNGLPDYLISLLRFCYHYCKVAVAPVVEPENRVDNPREAGVEAYLSVRLREPFRVRDFPHDALGIAMAGPQPGEGEALPRQPTRLLFIKNQNTFKRSIIWRLSDLPPFVAALVDGPRMLIDLIGPYDVAGYPQIVFQLLEYHDAGVVGFTTPAHFQI